jgi:hypothetical protein
LPYQEASPVWVNKTASLGGVVVVLSVDGLGLAVGVMIVEGLGVGVMVPEGLAVGLGVIDGLGLEIGVVVTEELGLGVGLITGVTGSELAGDN